MERKIKILITFIEAGMGHIVTAQAILDALKLKNIDNVEIISSNILQRTPVLQKYEKFLVEQTKMASKAKGYSATQFFFMKVFGPQTSLKFVHSTIYHKQRKQYVNELRKINPDIIIDTHYFASHCSCFYRDHYNKNCKVVTYNPDNNVHGWWDRRVDYFITNNELATDEAIKNNFPKEKVKQVFFITRQSLVDDNNSKEFYREKYGIPKDQFTVKIADGVYAEAKLEEFVKELVKSKKKMTIIAIAGKNKKLYEELKELSVPENIQLLPFEFVKDIHELFKASDLFITKAGPNAILDSVFLRVPILVNYSASTIEKKTKELFVDRLKCGTYIPDKKKARKFVENCIDNPHLLDKYIQNELKLDKNRNGATEIAELIAQIVKQMQEI